MTTRELLEMATLDALGLLEPSERDSFERAFKSAPVSVRRQVVREQRRLAADESLLPAVEIPAGLRERVLAAVREAMSTMRVDSPSDVLARILPNPVSMRRNVTPLWRAACIAFASATIMLLLAGFSLQQEIQRAVSASRDANLVSIISQEMGPEFAQALLSPQAQRVTFNKVPGTTTGSAAVLFDPESDLAFLMVNELKIYEGQYSLAIVDDQGRIKEKIATFAYTGGMSGRPMKIAQHLTSGTHLAILAPQSDKMLMRTTIV
jgi:anti-sigma-K factor RskA